MYKADACTHYFTENDILNAVKAASMNKLNVLLLELTCTYSFPLKLEDKLTNKLVWGSWTPYAYYEKAQM